MSSISKDTNSINSSSSPLKDKSGQSDHTQSKQEQSSTSSSQQLIEDNNYRPQPLNSNSSLNTNHQHHESIRNLIASNFKQQNDKQNPKPNNKNPLVSSFHSPDYNANPLLSSYNRKKSNSISNGVLSHSRSLKKVSFSNFNSKNTSQNFENETSSSSNVSIDNTDNESSDGKDDDEEEEDLSSTEHNDKFQQGDVTLRRPDFNGSHSSEKITRNHLHNNQQINDEENSKRLAHFTTSVTPSPANLSPAMSSVALHNKRNRMNKSPRFQYGGEKLALSKSLDSQLLDYSDSNNSTTSFLPEFNKRPLTDTPMVSHVGSPEVRNDDDGDDNDVQFGDGEDENYSGDDEEENDKTIENIKQTTKDEKDLNKSKKNISHLNLSELVDDQSSSNSETESMNRARNSAAHAGASLVGTQSTFTGDIRRPTYVPASSTPNILKNSEFISDEFNRSSSISPMTSITEVEKHKLNQKRNSELENKKQRNLEIEKEQQKQKYGDKEIIPSGNKKLNITEDMAKLLKDVPSHMKEEFEKTPSIEQLKNLLLTKPPPSARKTYTLNIPGQTSSKTSPDGKIASIDVGSKLVIVMVGLPARGKSYITNKLTRYLNWLQHDCRVFNVGNTRRKSKLNAGPEKNPLPDSHTPTEAQSPIQNGINGTSNNNNNNNSDVKALTSFKQDSAEHDANFFNPNNKASTTLREKWAMDTLEQLLDYVILGSGSVGIFDATNSTKHRRKKVLKRIQERSKGELKVLFLESICSDPQIIENNIRLKLSGPDYKKMDPEIALKDFVGRLQNYEKAYETIDEEEEKIPGFQYVKMIDVGKKVVSFNIQGFLSSQTIYFLLNFNLCERQIWLTRHGESKDNVNGKIGGDSKLTKRGKKFSKALSKFMNFQREEFRKQQLERFSTRLELKYNSIFNENQEEEDVTMIPTEPNFCVWTSMLTRSVETGEYFNESLYSIKQMRMLNEIGAGKCEGMTYEEIQNKYPKEFQQRLDNKLTYRYPGVGGESYLDVLTRLRPLITEIERTTDHLLIISHRVVLRILISYFLNLQPLDIVTLDVPLHSLYKLETNPYGTTYSLYSYKEEIDWFIETKPEHQKNVQEMGLAFNEKRFSIVPTVPSKHSL
ncbi:PFK26 [Candida pseudojiufengensis]|uniref:PFK26 n=1 Tax=Candida pseudojiufengensis TaxID=497109 RepID=UPI0022245C5A|nr:PFK26 [Candida pseudojiufengensis]KAI5963815.1 PFK26 [Candida pseudojiufengensis]